MTVFNNIIPLGKPGWLRQARVRLSVSTQVMVSGPEIEPHVGLHALQKPGVCWRFFPPPTPSPDPHHMLMCSLSNT